ncbi:DUF3068 domain-containing protein [Streptomyces sp. SID5914]|nr:DUF3068 domain-containing protein [Streptomyces sp. SID5914]MZG19365.1 DUF3068 domain-containing protein [Streptomyces sp. SID5914]
MLRRTHSRLALSLLGAGVFLLVLAPMLTWYVAPRAKVSPINVDQTAVLTGQGSYFDIGSLSALRNQKITLTSHVLGDVSASERSGRAVWDVSTTVDTPKSLPLKDPRRSLLWITARSVTDRRTNQPVHCCGETPYFDGEAYLKFPFDVEKRTYRWWYDTLGAAVPLRFAGTTKVLGHEGYRFVGSVPPTKTGTRQVPGLLVDRPEQAQVFAEQWFSDAGVELVVDPSTGMVINSTIAPKVTLRAPGGKRDMVTLLQTDRLTLPKSELQAGVTTASDLSHQLRLISKTVPATAAAAGAPIAVIGLTLLIRGRRKLPPESHPPALSPEVSEVEPAADAAHGRGTLLKDRG